MIWVVNKLFFANQFRPRDEASSATIGNTTYVLGGIGERTMEFISMEYADSLTTEVVRLVYRY